MRNSQAVPRRSLLSRSGRDVDMTQGGILRHIIVFAIPLLLGNLFQQLYNTVDTWVIGNFVEDKNAYSAVGSLNPIINLLIGTFMGFSSGAGVVISQYYGAGRKEDVSRAVHTALVMTLVLGIALTAIGLLLMPFLLDFMKMDKEIQVQAKIYLGIYFSGLMGLVVYNMGSGILRAVGDSTRPFIFLVICALMNTGLDLLFVIVFGMGVEGVALATIISQGVSGLLVLGVLFSTDSCVKVRLKSLRVYRDVLGKIVLVGVPAALQMSITAFSNVFGQSYINHFKGDAMSGWGTYLKVDQFLFLPMQSISLACTTFVGQNLGKNQIQRAKDGVRKSVTLSLAATGILMVPIIVFAEPIAGFFNPKPEVVAHAATLLRFITPFYLMCCFNQILSSALRGAGNTKAPMLIMITSFVVVRQVYMFVLSRLWPEHTLLSIGMGYPVGWTLCTVLTAIYYAKVPLGKNRLVEE